MDIHEAANIFPLDEENLAELAADIREYGLQVPIETLNGEVIDGRRRLRACEMAGVRPMFKAVTAVDPIAYVLSLNLHRRHLSPTQKAMVAARAKEWYDKQAKDRQKASGGDKKSAGAKSVRENLPEPIQDAGRARDQAGKALGVSGKSVDSATRILNQGTPKLIAAVEADQIAVSTAARAASLSEAEQDALADRAAENAKEGRRRARPADEEDEEKPEGQLKGNGVILAHEAINCLTRIPKNDALRKRGFQIVTDWIKRNK